MKNRIRLGASDKKTIVLSAALIAIGVALCAVSLGREIASPTSAALSLPILAAIFAGAESMAIHYNFRSLTRTFAPTEAALVIAMLLASPRHAVIAGVAGTLTARLLVRKQRGLKLLFNSSLSFVEQTVAVTLFLAVSSDRMLHNSRTWIAIAVSIFVTNAVGEIAMNILLSVRGATLEKFATFSIGPAAVGSALFGAMIVLAFHGSPFLVIVPGIGAVIVRSAFVSFTQLRQRHDRLRTLHEFISRVDDGMDFPTFLSHAAEGSREGLWALGCEVVLVEDGKVVYRHGAGEIGEEVVISGDFIWSELLNQRAVLLSATDTNSTVRSYLKRTALRDLIAAPLVGDDGVLGWVCLQNRSNSFNTFSEEDLEILKTMCTHISGGIENLTLIRELEREVATREYQATHDSLTDLPNRAYFLREVAVHLDRFASSGRRFAVGIVDINRFKEINDTLGHDVGDRVISQAGHRLFDHLGGESVAARLGGDEFALLFADIKDNADLEARANSVLALFNEPLELGTACVPVDIALGIAQAPLHGGEFGALLKRADVAMYAAKEERKSAFAFYKVSQERSSERQLGLVTDLRNAIDNDLLVVHYQPKADMSTGTVVGAEALVRWQHVDGSWVAPDEFIPIAERTGLIGRLTICVLSNAIAQCAIWHSRGHRLQVAVNVSYLSLQDSTFAASVQGLLHRYQLPSDALMLEVTERELVGDSERALTTMANLREIGVRFSIDDFGTGYSSLAYLTRLPVDEVKIDRSFVTNIESSVSDQAIVRAVVQIAKSIGLTTVAEGIEKPGCWNTLRDLGCDHAQGYLLAYPMQVQEILQWLDARAKTSNATPNWSA